MVQPLAALLSFAFLVAGPPPVDTPPPDAPPAAGALAAVATPPAAGFAAPTPTDETGWLLQAAPPAAAPALDLRRPRLLASERPDVPHPAAAAVHDRGDDRPRFDLHLVRMTKDRGS